MKYFLIGLTIFIAVAIFVFLWGRTIPSQHEVMVEEKINAPIDTVWNIMTDWKNQTLWRSEVGKIDIISPTKFIEHPKQGPAITFEVLKLQRPHSFELSMSGSIQGSYIATLSFSEGMTTVIAKETVINNSVINRLVSKLFFDLEKFAKTYLLQLKTQSESKRT